MILETEQKVAEQQKKSEPEFHFAKVAAVYADGLSLYIGAESTPTEKHYKCNTTCKFKAGQKVYIQKANGEYIVLFPVGTPNTNQVLNFMGYLPNKTAVNEIENGIWDCDGSHKPNPAPDGLNDDMTIIKAGRYLQATDLFGNAKRWDYYYGVWKNSD